MTLLVGATGAWRAVVCKSRGMRSEGGTYENNCHDDESLQVHVRESRWLLGVAEVRDYFGEELAVIFARLRLKGVQR